VAEKGVRSLLLEGSIIGDHHRTQGFQDHCHGCTP
jgi:hypothetical protein